MDTWILLALGHVSSIKNFFVYIYVLRWRMKILVIRVFIIIIGNIILHIHYYTSIVRYTNEKKMFEHRWNNV